MQAVGADLRVRTAWPANRKRRAKQTGRQVRLLANLDLSGLAITLKWGPSKGPVIPEAARERVYPGSRAMRTRVAQIPDRAVRVRDDGWGWVMTGGV